MREAAEAIRGLIQKGPADFDNSVRDGYGPVSDERF
jgi:hypothetical protein